MRWRLTFLALSALTVSSCGPLVQIGAKDPLPQALYTVRAFAPPQQVPQRQDLTILIETPTVPAALETRRVPVTTSDTEVAYLVDALWIEQPASLLLPLFADVVESRTGAIVTSIADYDVLPAFRLGGQLRSFGLDVRDGANPQVTIRYDAILSRTNVGLIASRRFEASEAIPSQTGPEVAEALNRAANRLAIEVADWIAASLRGPQPAWARP